MKKKDSKKLTKKPVVTATNQGVESPFMSLADAMHNVTNKGFWDPFGMISEYLDDEMVDELLGEHGAMGTQFFPNMNVSETSSEVIVMAELPGIESKNLAIEVAEGDITIAGLIQMVPNGRTYLHECFTGEFKRKMPLPSYVDIATAKAELLNGMLRVTMQKVGQRKAVKNIHINPDNSQFGGNK